MNREQCQSLLPIMQAFAEGKEVQFKRTDQDDSHWTTLVNWPWEKAQYYSEQFRIKPEPLEIEVWVDREGCAIEIATLLGPKKAHWGKKKFREVTD